MSSIEEKIYLIDKTKGKSSFDVIRDLRKKLGIRKMGHAGTLDPLATGLMLIGVGKATKELTDLVGLDKVYEAKVVLGERRATGDLEGEILEEVVIKDVNQEDVLRALDKLEGKHILPVPIYSAMKRGGEELYKKARRGEKFKPTEREMEIYEAKLVDIYNEGDRVCLDVIFHVSSGTYIRSLAEEVGNILGYPATLGGLRRISVGEYNIEDVDFVV